MSTVVTLRTITDANRDEVLALAVGPDQTHFVDGVEASLAEAAAKPEANPWFRAIYAGEQPVGFVMLADGTEPGRSEFAWPFYLWRLLIDARHQGQGYGAAALDLVVAHVRSRPDAVELVTSIVPGPGSPAGFYERAGFVPTGQMWDHEQLYALTLR